MPISGIFLWMTLGVAHESASTKKYSQYHKWKSQLMRGKSQTMHQPWHLLPEHISHKFWMCNLLWLLMYGDADYSSYLLNSLKEKHHTGDWTSGTLKLNQLTKMLGLSFNEGCIWEITSLGSLMVPCTHGQDHLSPAVSRTGKLIREGSDRNLWSNSAPCTGQIWLRNHWLPNFSLFSKAMTTGLGPKLIESFTRLRNTNQ